MLRADPVGEDTVTSERTRANSAVDEANEDLYGEAENTAVDGARRDDLGDEDEFNEQPSNEEFLQMVREAEAQAELYANQVNRKQWAQVYKAFHNEHFTGSKYESSDWTNRSKLFVPQTRKAVRKDLAAVAASLFGSIDAVNVMAGNEGDPRQRGSAAVIQEIMNYRTDRASGKASIPWFHVALGARQDSILTGICVSKQSWKLELKRTATEEVDGEDGEKALRDVFEPYIDRPDSELIPPENVVVDPAASWTNPAQDAGYFIIKWPMRIDEIRRKQRDPRNPWNELTDGQLRGAREKGKYDMAAIRRAREQGIDRLDDVQQNRKSFEVIWVYETYIRTAGEDWTFLSVGDKWMLTDPKPVSEVYPEQFGERPIVMGYGSFESHRIFPMANAASWQPLQMEMNDLRNLTLDAVKQNVTPVSKVVRGRQVDLDQLKRRAHGSSVMVTKPEDVTWDRPPEIPQSVQAMKQALDIDFDDLAGQQNYGTVENNNALGKTLGGLKLAAGAANAVQEFDIRIWIETWCEPVLAQIVRLIQYYESDPIVLGLCGERAKLMQKYGIDKIDDELLENNVTLRVNIGLGSGDPQQRLAKFNSAVQVALPLLQMDPDFASGKKQINGDAIMEEVFGGAGYRDGGARFIKEGQGPQQDPKSQPEIDKIKSETDKNKALAKKALIDALSGAAKVGIMIKDLELAEIQSQFGRSVDHMDQMGRAMEMGHGHGLALKAQEMAAKGLNVDGSPIDMPGTPPGADYPDGKVPEGVLNGTAPPQGESASPTGPEQVPEQSPTPPAPAGGGGLADAFAAEPPPPEAAQAPAEAAPAAPKKKTRKVRITGRDPKTNRANAFEIDDED